VDRSAPNENGAALTGLGEGEGGRKPATGGSFDELLLPVADEEGDTQDDVTGVGRGGRGLVVVTIGAALLGVGILVGALTLPPAAGGSSDATATVPGVVPTPTPDPVSAAEPAVELTREPDGGITAFVDTVWAARTAGSVGIPERAMLAYAGAELRIAEEMPSCRLGWNTLAGIGHVESGHGTIDGSAIDAEGYASPRIFGPTLNVAEYDIVRDTDDGLLDDDPRWDRAVGPLQLLPSTWRDWGTDGGGDGVADPQNLDDAALTAGRYLCDAGGDLSESQNWLDAIWSYNPTNEYAVAVSAAARYYAGG
jgi:membrane-bound lytic murein transglycosylase B